MIIKNMKLIFSILIVLFIVIETTQNVFASGDCAGPAGGCPGGDAGGCCGGSCFLPGTLITMSDGTTKKIEDVKVGEKVLGYDIETNKYTENTVYELEAPIRSEWFEVILDNGRTLRTTDDHPIYVKEYNDWASIDPEATWKNSGYKMETQQLKIGQYVMDLDQKYSRILFILNVPEEVQTYNLKKVSNNNTFFAENTLVHNKNDDPTTVTCDDSLNVWSDWTDCSNEPCGTICKIIRTKIKTTVNTNYGDCIQPEKGDCFGGYNPACKDTTITEISTGNAPACPILDCDLVLSKSSVNIGETVKASWTSTNADSASVSYTTSAGTSGPYSLATSGKNVTSPAINEKTTFDITVVSSTGGTFTCSDNVTVKTSTSVCKPNNCAATTCTTNTCWNGCTDVVGTLNCSNPVNNSNSSLPTCTLTVPKSSINSGEKILITYSATDATIFNISPTLGNVSAATKALGYVKPSSTTTYTGTVTGPGGSNTCSVKVTVNGGVNNNNNNTTTTTTVNNATIVLNPVNPGVSSYGSCSATNACGVTNSGSWSTIKVCNNPKDPKNCYDTQVCSGVSMPPLPADYGTQCYSLYNTCFKRDVMIIYCNGCTIANTMPPVTSCPKPIIKDGDFRTDDNVYWVIKGKTKTLEWSGITYVTACKITGPNGQILMSKTYGENYSTGKDTISGNVVTDPILHESDFTMTCQNGTDGQNGPDDVAPKASKIVTITLIPLYQDL